LTGARRVPVGECNAGGDSATNAVTKAGTMMARFMTFPYLQLHSGHDRAPQPVHVGEQFFVIGTPN
jgi:hypothetical protein